jgi:hypothetical protein
MEAKVMTRRAQWTIGLLLLACLFGAGPSSLGDDSRPSAPVLPAAGERWTMVVCAPGFPGTTAEAQPTMDQFAERAARAAGWPQASLAAVYHESEEPGVDRLSKPDAAFALVPLPFFVKHAADLGLTPRLVAVQETGATEVWSLVAKKGQLTGPASLGGWEITGMAGYAESFVLGPALAAWGRPPAGVRVGFTARTLAALRRASAGEKVAVLLDQAAAASLASLPFANDLEVVTKTKPLPASLLCSIRGRIPAGQADALVKALARLHEKPEGAEILKTMRMTRFDALSGSALADLAAAGAPATRIAK